MIALLAPCLLINKDQHTRRGSGEDRHCPCFQDSVSKAYPHQVILTMQILKVNQIDEYSNSSMKQHTTTWVMAGFCKGIYIGIIELKIVLKIMKILVFFFYILPWGLEAPCWTNSLAEGCMRKAL